MHPFTHSFPREREEEQRGQWTNGKRPMVQEDLAWRRRVVLEAGAGAPSFVLGALSVVRIK